MKFRRKSAEPASVADDADDVLEGADTSGASGLPVTRGLEG